MSKAILFAIMLISSIFRGPGAWYGSKLGIVARHAVGWLTAFLGAELAILFFNFVEAPDHVLRDIRGKLGALDILVGLLIATGAEAFMSVFEYLWPAARPGKASSLDVWDRDMGG